MEVIIRSLVAQDRTVSRHAKATHRRRKRSPIQTRIANATMATTPLGPTNCGKWLSAFTPMRSHDAFRVQIVELAGPVRQP